MRGTTITSTAPTRPLVIEKVITSPAVVDHNIKCLNYDKPSRPAAPAKWMAVLNDAMAIFNDNDYQFSLAFGTLLHMYRDCGLLPDTGDVDVAVPLKTLTEEMLAKFYAEDWVFFRSFGTEGSPGYEVALKHPSGLKLDIYGETSEGDFTWQAVWVNRRAFMCAYTNPSNWFTLHVDHVTSYPVHGNPEEFFKGVYGLNWRTPIPTSGYNWINPRCIKSDYVF